MALLGSYPLVYCLLGVLTLAALPLLGPGAGRIHAAVGLPEPAG